MLFRSRYDLATDQEASDDLRTFAQSEFGVVAQRRYLQAPEESLLDRLISRASGLFIFIKTLALALERCADPADFLKATAEEAGAGLKPLYGLYSQILNSRIVHSNAKFRRVIGVLLTVAPYRALCDETIAELAGAYPNLVKRWMDGLSSLLHRGTNGEIRVRHLSISEFFHSNDCPSKYRIDPTDANIHLGIVCLETMISKLRFNICGLEDSRVANTDVKDLQSRITENISDALQYSSLYWSDHLCFTPDDHDREVWKSLEEFFLGLCPLFWSEVLSILGRVPIGAPSIRKLTSWAKVSSSSNLYSG